MQPQKNKETKKISTTKIKSWKSNKPQFWCSPHSCRSTQDDTTLLPVMPKID